MVLSVFRDMKSHQSSWQNNNLHPSEHRFSVHQRQVFKQEFVGICVVVLSLSRLSAHTGRRRIIFDSKSAAIKTAALEQ